MKLSLAPISLDRYFDTDKDMRTILELTRDCGFTYIDYDIKQKYLEGDYIEHAERLKKNLAELGMTAAQAHAPIINPMNPGEVDYMEMYKRSLHFCQIVGIPQVVMMT